MILFLRAILNVKLGSFIDRRNRQVSYDKAIIINAEYEEDGKVRPVVLKTLTTDFEKFSKLVNDLKPYDKINCEINFLPYNKLSSFYLLNAKKV